MLLFFTRFKGHHEALNALRFLMQGQLRQVEAWQDTGFDALGFDIGQQLPRHHITALYQGLERAVGAVDAGAGAHGQRKTGATHVLDASKASARMIHRNLAVNFMKMKALQFVISGTPK
jgi:hypothetical protein